MTRNQQNVLDRHLQDVALTMKLNRRFTPVQAAAMALTVRDRFTASASLRYYPNADKYASLAGTCFDTLHDLTTALFRAVNGPRRSTYVFVPFEGVDYIVR